MRVNAQVKNKTIRFGGLIAQERFFERAEGKHIIITLDESPTAEKRRYFEGCLVPVMFYSHPHSGWGSFADAREILKVNFLPIKLVETDKPLKGLGRGNALVVPSTTNLSNKAFGEFIEAIVAWLRENVMVPEEAFDPENYKMWRDSAPSPEEVYPPLARLKERYDSEKYGHDAQGSVPGEGLEGRK